MDIQHEKWIFHILFTYSVVNGHLAFFLFLTIEQNAAVTFFSKFLCEIGF